MKYNIAILHAQGSEYWKCAEDITRPLAAALTNMGHTVDVSTQMLSRRATNIIFGLQDIPDFPQDKIPEDSIIYNFEQITKGSKGLRPHYIEALQKFTVWEYSIRNFELLKRNFGISNIHHVPFGYTGQMSCINPDYPKDIDVLLYGYLNDRRKHIINELNKRGIKAVALEKVFGHERNFHIARSRIMLNVHFYTPGILEVARIGFLLANGKTVVSERNPDTFVPAEYEGTCAFAPYDALIDTTLELLENTSACAQQGQIGHQIFARQRYEDILAKVTDTPQAGPLTQPRLPRKINAGSGKDFREDCLNIDIDPKWRPDLLLDLSTPFTPGTTYQTRRFGVQELPEGYFSTIETNDVLEHVPDVVATMTNFLNLLEPGGTLQISVPYDLSLGAWQDPTHVRAFNEMSFRYYTDWSWYIGWKDYRFEMVDLKYTLSNIGMALNAQGIQADNITRTPRAVENMEVTLRKRATTAEEKLEYDLRHHAFYAE